VTALLSIASTLVIDPRSIDHGRARGLLEGKSAAAAKPSALETLLTCRGLLIFCLCGMSFNLANGAMLPLLGQKLVLQDPNEGTALMSACIVAAQVVMIPMATLVGRKADSWGRKPLVLAAFAILPLRASLYTFSDDRFWLVGVQLLGGVGAGLYSVLFVLVVADLTRGSGHFNLAQGAVNTAHGLGAALSAALAGFIVVRAGYSVAFLTLGAIAAGGFLL
jgi:MFS family permease